jgi:REP element-mobilizing transposase RayT
MPRTPRIDIPGLLQHVIVRGIERSAIFLDDQDHEDFLARLGTLLHESRTDCYAWALLDNHFHLLLRPREQPLCVLMRRLLTGYAVVFNLRHNRSGHLFQNRYKSIVCDDDPYLLELLRYIHLNPLRAGVVDSLNTLEYFPWCGHGELLGRSTRNLINTAEALSFFAPRRSAARRCYHEFLAAGAPDIKLSRGGRKASRSIDKSLAEDDLFDERILGGGAFVERLTRGNSCAADLGLQSLDDLLEAVAGHYGLQLSALCCPNKERTVTSAKAAICYLAVRHMRVRGIDLATRLGFSSTAVSQAAKRGKIFVAESAELQKIALPFMKL